MDFLNIAGYRFVPIQDCSALRQQLNELTHDLGLKGTILISTEGINIFLSGTAITIKAFKQEFETDARFIKMEWKDSHSSEIAFNRMLVKIKQEIIPMGQPEINPITNPAPFIDPKTLATWLDEGKSITLLDTRNVFEIKIGSFENATHLNLSRFRDFSNAASTLNENLRNKPIVTFCTGGIRCEKAAPLLKKIGFNEVYQLQGGILNYFEQVGRRHYKGDCFVFDKRVALTPELTQSQYKMCFNCQRPLNLEEQQSSDYIPDISCPGCIVR
ncbi:MAG: sulfurtransferase [Proteobacteria bacterium]|nr:sulfurtransferase [Pseudomonadota bacterium]MDE3207867.1 sulfurtransferase [Pseudomonadota bacterium]